MDDRELKKGSAELLILSLVEARARHGYEISKLIEARGLSQKQAAALLRVSQPRISDLVRGKIERFSIDTLVEMLGHAGIDVRFTTQRHVA